MSVVAEKPRMVMRSIYLPEDLDLVLRRYAFGSNISKGELIRAFIRQGLESRGLVAAADTEETAQTPA